MTLFTAVQKTLKKRFSSAVTLGVWSYADCAGLSVVQENLTQLVKQQTNNRTNVMESWHWNVMLLHQHLDSFNWLPLLNLCVDCLQESPYKESYCLTLGAERIYDRYHLTGCQVSFIVIFSTCTTHRLNWISVFDTTSNQFIPADILKVWISLRSPVFYMIKT